MGQREKTFAEMVAETQNLYDSEVDQATKDAIFDWFQFRRVTDNERFPVYFRRIMRRDYSRYKQLLRIEAGKTGDTGVATNYDWLVTEYLERQDISTTENSTSRTTSGTSSQTTDTESLVTNGGSDVVTYENEVERGGSRETHGTRTSQIDDLKSGSVNTRTDGTTSTADHNSGITKGNTGETTETRAGVLARSQPMTATYTEQEMTAKDTSHGVVKRFEEPQGYSAVKAGEDVWDGSSADGAPQNGNNYIWGLHNNFPDLKIKNPTSASDEHSTSGSVQDTRTETLGDSTHSATTSDSTVTTTRDDDERTETGRNDETTTDTATETAESTTTTAHGQTISTDGSSSVSGSTSGTERGTGESETRNQYRHTGHNGEIAEIMKRATEYIKISSAFEWFRGQLEPCFMAVFE